MGAYIDLETDIITFDNYEDMIRYLTLFNPSNVVIDIVREGDDDGE